MAHIPHIAGNKASNDPLEHPKQYSMLNYEHEAHERTCSALASNSPASIVFTWTAQDCLRSRSSINFITLDQAKGVGLLIFSSLATMKATVGNTRMIRSHRMAHECSRNETLARISAGRVDLTQTKEQTHHHSSLLRVCGTIYSSEKKP